MPLGEEMRAVAHYLEVEKVRFEDDLDVQIDVDPLAAKRLLPAFLVLPFVENAIKHGRRTSAMPLRVRVAGRVEAGALYIEVKNTGRWVTRRQRRSSRPPGPAPGCRNVRERLAAHYHGTPRVRRTRGGRLGARTNPDRPCRLSRCA